MLFRTKVIVFRNETIIGEYNRPYKTLVEVGETKGTLSRNDKPYVIQKAVQGEAEEEFTLFYKRNGDIKEHDILQIDDRKYIAQVPRKYKRHNEIILQYKTEV